MACGCSGKRAQVQAPRGVPAARSASNPKGKGNTLPLALVKIQYAGPIGSHLVPSPLRRVATYGLHTRGDVFEVDSGDQETNPGVFVLVKDGNGQN